MTSLPITTVLGIVLIAILGARGSHAQAPFDSKVLHIGAVAPELPYLKVSDGQRGSLISHKGKILVLEFWATWCAPCQPAMDELQKIATRYTAHKDKIEFLAISIDGVEDKNKGAAFTGKRPDLVEKVAAHVKQKAWTHTINAWSSVEDLKAWPIRMVPLTFVIGKDGRIIHLPGPEKLEGIIAPLIEQTP